MVCRSRRAGDGQFSKNVLQKRTRLLTCGQPGLVCFTNYVGFAFISATILRARNVVINLAPANHMAADRLG